MLKLIVSYSLIIILMLAVLTFVLSSSYSNVLKQDEINYEKQISRRVAEYFDERIDASKRIVQQIYTSDSNVKAAFFNFLSNDDRDMTLDYITQKNRIFGMFQSEAVGGNDILDIILYKSATKEVFLFTGTGRKLADNFDFSQYSWFRNVTENYGILRIIPSYSPKYIKNDSRPVYTAYAGFFNNDNSLSGVLIINFDANAMANSYAQYRDKVKGSIMVLNNQGSVFYDSTGRYYSSPYPYAAELRDSNDYIKLDADSIVALSETDDGYVAAGIVPKEQVLKGINQVIRTIFLIMVLCIGVSISMIYIISRHFSHRVRLITRAMKDVEQGNLKKRLPGSQGNDEVEQINRSFNSMCERLESYIEKVYLAEIKAKDAELTALQTQINPHFLYNTLESIRMKAILSKNGDIAEMVFILANLFKNSVKNKDMVIRIEDEIEYCKSYLDLHRIRLGERLKVSFRVDPAILQVGIPKLVLQPLIENALLYGGLEETMTALAIDIEGLEENHSVLLSVSDNGSGISPDALEALRAELSEDRGIKNDGSIGLRNINDRIRIIFGKGYGLEIASDENTGTRVTVRIPAMTVEEVRHIAKSIDR